MANRRELLQGLRAVGVLAGAAGLMAAFRGSLGGKSAHAADRVYEVTHSEAEWKKLLTPVQFDVLRRAGTEPPHSSPLNREHRAGTYLCAGCALPLYSSETKFESGTGWPSFWAPLAAAVDEVQESGFLFFTRTEVRCRRCGGHLGHVFDDGPKPTGLRYCMNGVALDFKPA